MGGAKVAVPSSPACMEKSQPGSSQHSLPAKEEPPRVGEEKPKPPKASSRVEDGGLETVAQRSEHVAITKPEPTVTTVSREMSDEAAVCLLTPLETHRCLDSFTKLIKNRSILQCPVAGGEELNCGDLVCKSLSSLSA